MATALNPNLYLTNFNLKLVLNIFSLFSTRSVKVIANILKAIN